MQPFPRAWVDGRLVDLQEALVPVTTHALHYGTSAFEGIRAYWNGENLFIFRLDDHVRRLQRSGSFYNMKPGYTEEQMARAITEVCRGNDIRESSYIRPLYFVSEWGISLHINTDAPTRFAVIAFPMQQYFRNGGISACVVSWRRFADQSTPVQAKMGGNYLNSILATTEARRNGFDEAIMLDQSGNISETAGANIFLVRDGHSGNTGQRILGTGRHNPGHGHTSGQETGNHHRAAPRLAQRALHLRRGIPDGYRQRGDPADQHRRTQHRVGAGERHLPSDGAVF